MPHLSLPEAMETAAVGIMRPLSRATAWAQMLLASCVDLEQLNRDTEQEFLRVGAKVMDFVEVAAGMSHDLSVIAGLASNDHGKQAVEALSSALDLTSEMRRRSEESNQMMTTMRQEARRLKETLSSFSGTVATFHSLGVLTRIETARLGEASADFGNLAEDVRLLARNVQSKVETALDTADELIPRIESALKKALALQEGQAKTLPEVMAQVLESLNSFRQMQKRSHESSTRLVAEFSEISGAFKRLIVSMQFNDITRQQLEHVIDALRRLSTQTSEDSGELLLARRGGVAVLELQSSQLANAGKTFTSSVESVLKSLNEIAEHIQQMLVETSSLGNSGSENDSFFNQMERGCALILDSLSRCASADAMTRETNCDLAKQIERMLASVGEVRAIETQMRRIAMNARISAEHLGPLGEALNALADSIKQRAVESRQGSDSLVETLNSMMAVAARTANKSQLDEGEREKQDLCLKGMRTAVADLRSSQENSAAQISKIWVRGERLCEDMVTTWESFTISQRFCETVAGTRANIMTIMEEARAGLVGEAEEAEDSVLAQFAGQYTMRSERIIHAGAVKPASAQANGHDTGLKDSDELADVEFF
jgi:hypothetical protein